MDDGYYDHPINQKGDVKMTFLTLARTGDLTMSSLEIAALTGKNHADVLRDIRNMLEGLEIGASNFAGSYKSEQNKDLPCYNLPKRETLILVSGYSISLRARIIDRWQELENATVPRVPATLSEALRLAADLADQKQLAIEQRDEAIRTKSEIGTRREATAMATASAQTRRANSLEIELDKSKRYASVKRMEMVCHGQKFDWRRLKSACIDLGIEPERVFDQNYGSVNAYPAEAWAEAYAIDINNI